MLSILWGFFHRCGGGLITCPGNKIIFRGIAPALIFWTLYPLNYLVIIMAAGFWLGNAILGYSDHWNMNNLKDWIYMTLRGGLFTIFPGFVLCLINPLAGFVLIISGLIMGVAYYLGKLWPNKGAGMMEGPECSEFVFGFLMGTINIAYFYLTNNH